MKQALPLLLLFAACQSTPGHGDMDIPALIVHPIDHATMVLEAEAVVYVDPVGGAERFRGFPAPDLVLVTDIHGDHLNPETLAALGGADLNLVAPAAVVEKLGYGTVLGNGERLVSAGVALEAVPMYNLTEERLKFHAKGRGNGYLLTLGGELVYISGDTEDIPEMRALEGIDRAFVCMNLPYTMTVDQAADAVIEFAPRVVVPYHHRGSDVDRFEALVRAGNPDVEVERLNWYP
ncbi:MAG: MBL fold metallo-hydrolase [Planctomycetota bacterium]|nr:MBL fold metallo-hydrolase [Planctomycetota bacterium]